MTPEPRFVSVRYRAFSSSPFDPEGETEAQGGGQRLSQGRTAKSGDATQVSRPPVQAAWTLVCGETPRWPFPRRPARREPSEKQMTQREGLPSPRRPVPPLCARRMPSSLARRVATCLGETRTRRPWRSGGWGRLSPAGASPNLPGPAGVGKTRSSARPPLSLSLAGIRASPARDWTLSASARLQPGLLGRGRERRPQSRSAASGTEAAAGLPGTGLRSPARASSPPARFIGSRPRTLGGVPLPSELGFSWRRHAPASHRNSRLRAAPLRGLPPLSDPALSAAHCSVSRRRCPRTSDLKLPCFLSPQS